jgi:hypothetical protein
MELQKALRTLATSSVIADRTAIARIEKATGENISTILEELENQDFVVLSWESESPDQHKKRVKSLIISTGLMCAGLSCLLTVWFRPNSPYLPIAVTPIAFVTGAAAQSMNLLRKP